MGVVLSTTAILCWIDLRIHDLPHPACQPGKHDQGRVAQIMSQAKEEVQKIVRCDYVLCKESRYVH